MHLRARSYIFILDGSIISNKQKCQILSYLMGRVDSENWGR